jgi:ADP-ribosylglycohydrolase
MTSARDRCAGVLWGLAAGDKNGGPIRMAVLLAESLVAQSGYDRDHVLSKYGAWYLGKDAEPCFDTGTTFWSVFKYMKNVCKRKGDERVRE